MPPFYLPDESGRIVSLEDLAVRGPVAVTFHRGHWCPFVASASTHWCVHTNRSLWKADRFVAVMPDRQQFVSDLRSTSKAPFLVLTDMDNGYALSLNLAIWVGDEIQKFIAERHDVARYQGNDFLGAADSGDVCGRPGRSHQGALCRSRLPQADDDRGSAGRHAVLNRSGLPNSFSPIRASSRQRCKTKHGPFFRRGPCSWVVSSTVEAAARRRYRFLPLRQPLMKFISERPSCSWSTVL